MSPSRSQATAIQSSQILAQTPSSPSSLKSQIQLQPTVLRIQNDDEEEEEDRAVEEEQGGASERVEGEGDYDGDDDGDDDIDEFDQPLTKIDVGPAWDDSDDEDDGQEQDDETGLPSRRQQRRRRVDPSYLHSLRPSPSRLRRYFARLTRSPAAQASLSAPHVSANLFSASLNPAVLLSMPAYFDRTGILIGIIGLVTVATLAGAGGGLWVVLGRYVGGNNIEAITAASTGRNTKWKGNLGRAFSGILLAVYATGTAVIAYFALADLLLQVFFHYSPRGIPLHDRLFVTLVVGGIITTPLVIFPLAKRNLIRLSTLCAVLFYPCILAILLSVIYRSTPTSSPREPNQAPSLNPLYPPSIWAPFSLLPLLSLSASPLQIIAHKRSLRRTGISGSNVKAFVAAQGAQTLVAVGVAIAFGVGIGTQGMSARLGVDIHPNLFTTLPLTNILNIARTLFIFILSTHLALCLVTARSSWARLLKLFHLNPLRKRVQKKTRAVNGDVEGGSEAGAGHSDSAHDTSTYMSIASNTRKENKKNPRRWGRRARDALAGLLLWSITAFTAYWSGVGGFHHKKGDESNSEDLIVEDNFTRAEEVLGLIGAGVGFVLPALVWIILFHIRRPRAILPPYAADMARQASAWFLGPLSVLARRKRDNNDAERQPLMENDESLQDETTSAARASTDSQNGRNSATSRQRMPYWGNEVEHADRDGDEGTRILLARKERQMQKRSRGKRLYQDIIVLAGILPLGVSLIVLGALDLKHGGW
ncbi:hypothetical protein CBS101457_006139 [Exobasidium rhododendri]|nr:hypothetical protein CBS101457_006139 [Exobasidium rhododendri]